MKRKLWLLNFALVALVAAGVWQLRKERQEFHKRERSTLGTKPPLPKPPAPLPSTPPPAVTASSYLDIAQKMLWSHDRNSQVIVDTKPAPPPKPLPTLPSVFGVMNIGDGPIVMMSDKPGARQRGVHPGEKIGEFKLVSVDGEKLVLAFEDRTVTKTLIELLDRGGVESGGAAIAGGSYQPSGTIPTPTAAPPPGKAEPGVKLSEGLSNCTTNDPSPAGTIINGMRKVVRQTPFGDSCFWEAVK